MRGRHRGIGQESLVARNVEVRVLEDEYSTAKHDNPLIYPGSSYQIHAKTLDTNKGAKTLTICDSRGEEVACIGVEPNSVSLDRNEGWLN